MNTSNISSIARSARSRGFALATGIFVVTLMNAVSLTAAAHPIDMNAESIDSLPGTEMVAPAAVSPDGNSGGCGKAAPHTGVFNLTTTDGNKKTRTFLVQVPGDYQSARAYPLHFIFHAAGGNSSQSYSWGLQAATGASENGIFVYPDGIAYQNYGIGWDDTKGGYDLPFFDNMVKALETSYCINTARVFVAGFSWGGDFVTSLICSRGQVIRAAAVNSATDEYRDKTNYWTYQGTVCPSTGHPSIRFEHAIGGDPVYPAPFFSQTSRLYRYFDTCSTASTSVASSTPVMACVSYNSCTKQYVECSFNSSLGHALPPNWASDTWKFFNSFQ